MPPRQKSGSINRNDFYLAPIRANLVPNLNTLHLKCMGWILAEIRRSILDLSL